jgi:RND superfamily putative drug exporter
VVVLAVLIVPTLRLKAWNMGVRDLSPDMEAHEGYELLNRNFAAGWMGPIALLLEVRGGGTVWTPDRESAISEMSVRLAADPRVHLAGGFSDLLARLGPSRALIRAKSDLPQPVQSLASRVVSDDGRSALAFLVPRSVPESEEVMAFVRELRSASWKKADDAGLDVRIGGFSASILDFDEELFGSLKRVVPLVLAVTFIVLVMAFRSIVVPLKAITMNLISVLAAYGFLVYVFQDGVGAGLIGLVPPGGLSSFIVLMLFTILFGLSMDYEVFLLSRILEAYGRTGDNRESVIRGLSQSGGLITSAALIMVVLFGSFGFTKLTATREFGLGLAFAVALDATLIRVLIRLMRPAKLVVPRRSYGGAFTTPCPHGYADDDERGWAGSGTAIPSPHRTDVAHPHRRLRGMRVAGRLGVRGARRHARAASHRHSTSRRFQVPAAAPAPPRRSPPHGAPEPTACWPR